MICDSKTSFDNVALVEYKKILNPEDDARLDFRSLRI